MTKEQALKEKESYYDEDGDLKGPYLIGVWITNKQGTDDWFLDVVCFYAHRPAGEGYDFEKVGY